MTTVTTEDGSGKTASTITTEDGTQIYFKDWGEGRPVVFSHGWPLNADAWEGQMVFLAQNGYRTIAHDRRGHGRSRQPSSCQGRAGGCGAAAGAQDRGQSRRCADRSPRRLTGRRRRRPLTIV